MPSVLCNLITLYPHSTYHVSSLLHNAPSSLQYFSSSARWSFASPMIPSVFPVLITFSIFFTIAPVSPVTTLLTPLFLSHLPAGHSNTSNCLNRSYKNADQIAHILRTLTQTGQPVVASQMLDVTNRQFWSTHVVQVCFTLCTCSQIKRNIQRLLLLLLRHTCTHLEHICTK